MTARRRMLTALILTLGAGSCCTWLATRALDAATTLLVAGPAHVGAAQLDELTALVLLAGGAVVSAWYAGTCALGLAVQTGRAAGSRVDALERVLRRWGFPVLRRVLLTTAATGMGAALAVGPSGAAAPETPVPVDLGWGATAAEPTPAPERPPEPTAPDARPGTAAGRQPPAQEHAHPPAGDAPAAADRARPESYTVRPGDSLWSIAAAHLGPDAADAEVAAAWPRWYRTNRALVGADPHLIHPGQELLAPTEETS